MTRKPRKPWSENEQAILVEHYPSLAANGVAAMLPGRTIQAIWTAAHLLGLQVQRLVIMPGQVFGALTALERCLDRKGVNTAWRCLCTCGRPIVVEGAKLKIGATKSCGCQRQANRRETLNKNYAAAGGMRKGRTNEEMINDSISTEMRIYKTACRIQGRSFELLFDEFKNMILSPCHYCGAPPTRKGRHAFSLLRYSGIDRKNNDPWYRTGDCVPCCKICNFRKGSMGYIEFIAWLDSVAAFRRPKTKKAVKAPNQLSLPAS